LESLDNVGNYLGKTQEAYSKARERLQTGRGNLVKRVDDIKRLGAKTKKSINSNLLEDAGALSETSTFPESGETVSLLNEDAESE
jgi:DNA recombination protein RmuC